MSDKRLRPFVEYPAMRCGHIGYPGQTECASCDPLKINAASVPPEPAPPTRELVFTPENPGGEIRVATPSPVGGQQECGRIFWSKAGQRRCLMPHPHKEPCVAYYEAGVANSSTPWPPATDEVAHSAAPPTSREAPAVGTQEEDFEKLLDSYRDEVWRLAQNPTKSYATKEEAFADHPELPAVEARKSIRDFVTALRNRCDAQQKKWLDASGELLQALDKIDALTQQNDRLARSLFDARERLSQSAARIAELEAAAKGWAKRLLDARYVTSKLEAFRNIESVENDIAAALSPPSPDTP